MGKLKKLCSDNSWNTRKVCTLKTLRCRSSRAKLTSRYQRLVWVTPLVKLVFSPSRGAYGACFSVIFTISSAGTNCNGKVCQVITAKDDPGKYNLAPQNYGIAKIPHVGWPYDHIHPQFHLFQRAHMHAFDLHAIPITLNFAQFAWRPKNVTVLFSSARQGKLLNVSCVFPPVCNYVSWTWTRLASWWHRDAAGKQTSDRPRKEEQI